MQRDCRFHEFDNEEIVGIELPEQFTYPFCYEPHRLSLVAADRLMRYVDSRDDWREELHGGKMMGVLVAECDDGRLGFLAAFSGNLAHSNNHEYFVPAVYDLLSEKGFFVPEESVISEINRKIETEMHCDARKAIVAQLTDLEADATDEIAQYRAMMKKSKEQRDMMRQAGADEKALIGESQYQKAELRRLQQRYRLLIDEVKSQLKERDGWVDEWKRERQSRSVALQMKIFRHFVMLNARGESRDLCDIFATTAQGVPPAGAGECAAPKLLQYAYLNGYKPLAMAEFWVGESPKDEVRRHGCFYPSCKAKCEPILGWMLQGLDVEPNKLEAKVDKPIDLLYVDEWIVAVNKPEGLLSVPGKLSVDSLQQRVQAMYPNESLLIVHRLDMATSGVLLFARRADVYKRLQAMFKSRDVNKCYVALLEGAVADERGVIELPICLNPEDRPRQIVSQEYGKQALTQYEVVERNDVCTRVLFYPITGRTHQLRVHASHRDGLNVPIVGDSLYGTVADRLYLHAHWVEFTHPMTGKRIKITSQVPF